MWMATEIPVLNIGYQWRYIVHDRFFTIELSHYHQYSLLASVAEDGFAQTQPLRIILTIDIAIRDLEAVFPVSLVLVTRT